MNYCFYLQNCFLLLLPLIPWNILLMDRLPAGFQPANFSKDIPLWIVVLENGVRVLLFGLPLFMPLSTKTPRQKSGLLLYLFGIALYFTSWLALIYYPESTWSTSIVGFTAPAWTTILFFSGIAIIGNSFFFTRWRYVTSLYFLLSIIFVMAHFAHAYMVYGRL